MRQRRAHNKLPVKVVNYEDLGFLELHSCRSDASRVLICCFVGKKQVNISRSFVRYPELYPIVPI
ncbi:hypothetical protein Plhal304r1_c031g0100271 [Plasmopara halstedii]